jgi:hypothetical protein
MRRKFLLEQVDGAIVFVQSGDPIAGVSECGMAVGFRQAHIAEGDIQRRLRIADDLKDCWQAVPAMASVSRGNAQ